MPNYEEDVIRTVNALDEVLADDNPNSPREVTVFAPIYRPCRTTLEAMFPEPNFWRALPRDLTATSAVIVDFVETQLGPQDQTELNRVGFMIVIYPQLNRTWLRPLYRFSTDELCAAFAHIFLTNETVFDSPTRLITDNSAQFLTAAWRRLQTRLRFVSHVVCTKLCYIP